MRVRVVPSKARSVEAAEGPGLSPRIKLLLEANLALATEYDLDSLLRRFTDIACELTDAAYGALFVEDIGTLVTFVTHGVSEEQAALIGDPPSRTGLHGQLLREGRTVVINDLPNDSRMTGYPKFHPVMRTFLGVPIRAGGRAIGELYLADKRKGRPFNGADVEMIESLAACAGVAYRNARLLQMEHRSAAHAISLLELGEHGQVDEVVFWSQVWAREEERARLARDIHDEQGQILTSIILFAKHLEQTVDAEVAEKVSGVRQLAEQALRAARSLAQQLRPLELDELGLVPALTRLAEHTEQRCGVVVDFVAPPKPIHLNHAAEIAVYRIAQEALTNVAKHSQAHSTSVTLSSRSGWLTLIIEDDGVGFDPDAVLGGSGHGGHLGLHSMEERARRLGGHLVVESRPSRGALLQLRLPLTDHAGRSRTWAAARSDER
ncbi:MAG TPA: GAF domain-containing sensor histidine kinase [Nocardioidaceae bacterium]|nr:GAF domain-containing sensor histidine kinase [Nocardioidaceae bacterium]